MAQEKERRSERREPITEQQMEKIQELAKAIRYGSIQLIFQDGILVQIDRSEKIRV